MSAYDEYLTEATAYWRAHPEQRKGQAFFNALALNRIDIADEVWGESQPGGRDPFYCDRDNLDPFLEHVRRRLEDDAEARR